MSPSFTTLLLESYGRDEQVILIIDEAQRLDPTLLEEVRLLTNLETPKSKLLQVILVGQPELNKILDSHELRQLKQRVTLRYHMQTLNEEETERYIDRRLQAAGAVDTHLFTRKALREIFKHSRGIPRVINIVCDNALLTGYAAERKVVDDRIVKGVIRKLEGPPGKRMKGKAWKINLWVFLAFLVILAGLMLFWGVPGSWDPLSRKWLLGP